MPVHFKIQANLIEFTLAGEFTLDDLEKVCRKAVLNPAFNSPMKVLIDTSKAPTDSSSRTIRKQADVLRSIKSHVSAKWAILARQGSLNFGQARMFAAHIGREDIETCVFADRPQAYRWLFDADTADKTQDRCAFPPLSEFKGWQPYP